MKFINKNSVIGFILGFIISPVIITGGLYLILKLQEPEMKRIAFPPPQIPFHGKISFDWKVKRLDGSEMNLKEELEDQVVFLNFWATWCPPCRGEMPSIEALYRKYNGRIVFACISNEDIAKIRDFRDAKKYTFPMYHMEGEPPKEFETEGIPATFIISRDGSVVLKHVGGANWAHETVVKFLDDLLNNEASG